MLLPRTGHNSKGPPMEHDRQSPISGLQTADSVSPDAPVWKLQPWYPLLLEMVVETPALLPNKRNLIQPTHQVNQLDTSPQLAVWVISGRSSEAKNFWRKLQDCSYPLGDPNHPGLTTRCSQSGPAGVVRGALIPFQEI